MAADLRTVTGIRGTRGSARRILYLDDEAWRAVPAPVLRELGIAVGDVIDIGDIETSLAAAEPVAARERAYRMLAYRDRTASEMTGRLLGDGYTESIVNALVDDLTSSGIIDDVRLAGPLAASLVTYRGYGRQRALHELERRGVPADMARRALDEAAPEDEESDRALERASRLMRPGDTPARLAGRLVRRGFRSRDAIRAAERALGPEGGSNSEDGL
jgi:regulatory protein